MVLRNNYFNWFSCLMVFGSLVSWFFVRFNCLSFLRFLIFFGREFRLFFFKCKKLSLFSFLIDEGSDLSWYLINFSLNSFFNFLIFVGIFWIGLNESERKIKFFIFKIFIGKEVRFCFERLSFVIFFGFFFVFFKDLVKIFFLGIWVCNRVGNKRI